MTGGPQGPYQVDLTAPAKRALHRIPERAAVAAVDLIYGDLAENPHQVGKALRFDLDGVHSARRGDYRILYTIDDEERTVVIRTIAHRSDVYRT